MRTAAVSGVVLLGAALGGLVTGCGGQHATAARTPASSATGSATSPAPVSGPLSAASARRIVDAAVLGNEDLGGGWSGALLGGGATLGQPTLDLCDTTYPSDKLRLVRKQTVLTSRTAAVSNEVVAYRSGGAAQAVREARSAIGTCQHHSSTDADGNTVEDTLTALSPHPGWGANAVAIRDVQVSDGETATYTAVFVAQGDVLTAVYSWDGAADADTVLGAADVADRRLTDALAGRAETHGNVPVPAGSPLAPESDSPQDSVPPDSVPPDSTEPSSPDLPTPGPSSDDGGGTGGGILT